MHNPNYPWINGRIHSGHFMFFADPTLRFAEVLGQLGFEDAKRRPDLSSGPYITRCDNWIHIADDWHYGIWHQRERVERLKRLSKHSDVFEFLSGDSCESVEFSLYRGGKWWRHRRVDSPGLFDRVLRIDVGDPLPNETDQLLQSDAMTIGFTLAEGLGINLDVQARPLVSHEIPLPESSKRFRSADLGI